MDSNGENLRLLTRYRKIIENLWRKRLLLAYDPSRFRLNEER